MTLNEALEGNPYQGYAYSYPHKTAYREIEPAIPLKQLWATENLDALFLYIHIPFCEMRCGFCNLFTMANPQQDLIQKYLVSLKKQAIVVKEGLREAKFVRLAVGGGTPSFLEKDQLEQLFFIIEEIMQVPLHLIPFSFEVSPKTISPSKLEYLHKKGVDRISMGIQSFQEKETKLLGRPQSNLEVFQALDAIRQQNFSILNLDLIYGGAGQSPSSWQDTLERTLRYQPEEIYLYPLYVRPLTGLEKMGMDWDNFRLQLYRQGRDFLIANGYEQLSMRMFRLPKAIASTYPVYCCQEDGMVGLGAGARSYTQSLHYATEYAVRRKGVKSIIQEYTEKDPNDFNYAHYGISLNQEEQKRRYIIKSLLHSDGLAFSRYYQLFGSKPLDDYPQLNELVQYDLAHISDSNTMQLNASGLERSDTIGPWLYSNKINELMHQFDLR